MKPIIFLSVFFSFSVLGAPCGTEGSIDERIKNCNQSKGSFALVVRSEKGLEIFKDTKTGMIWGDRITTDFNHYGSQRACTHDLAEAEILKDVKWRLPTIKEFEQAASHEMKTSVSHMEHAFWTSTPVKMKYRSRRQRQLIPSQVYLWDGMTEKADVGDIKDAASIRCVGKYSL